MFRSAAFVALNRLRMRFSTMLGLDYTISRFQCEGVKDVVSCNVRHSREGASVRVDVHAREVAGPEVDDDEALFLFLKPRFLSARDDLRRALALKEKTELLWNGPELAPYPKQSTLDTSDWSIAHPAKPNPEQLHFRLEKLRVRLAKALGKAWVLGPFCPSGGSGATTKLVHKASDHWSLVTFYESNFKGFVFAAQEFGYVQDKLLQECQILEARIKEREEKQAFIMQEAADGIPIGLNDWIPDVPSVEQNRKIWVPPLPDATDRPEQEPVRIPYKMNAKETREAAAVMRMQSSGCTVDSRLRESKEWKPCAHPFWDWAKNEYCLTPTQQTVKRWLVSSVGAADAVFLKKEDAEAILKMRGNGRIVELHGVEKAERTFEHEQCWMVVGKVHDEVRRYTFLDPVSAEKCAKNIKDGVIVELHGARLVTK
jgi:hypothetical protein